MYESQFDPRAANDPSVKTESNRSEWQPMPAGALVDLQSRLRRRASRRRFIQATSVAGVFATIVGVGYWTRAKLIAGRGQNYDFAGLTCEEAINAVPEIVAGRAPAELAAKVRDHISQCPACRPHFPDFPQLG